MIVRAECEKCSHKWDLEMKPMETITCPNCKTVYNALIVVNDPENEKTMRIVRENRSRKMNKVTHNCDNINCNHNDTKGLCCLFNPENCKYRQLQKENAELRADNDARKFAMAMSEKVEKQLREENAELKSRVGLSIECDKAQKNGELCLGYGGDEDEPCERCKNCIKCETGYFQLRETEKDEQLTKAKEIIEKLRALYLSPVVTKEDVKRQDEILNEAEQFLIEAEK